MTFQCILSFLLIFSSADTELAYQRVCNQTFSALQRSVNILIGVYVGVYTLTYSIRAVTQPDFDYMSILYGLLPLYISGVSGYLIHRLSIYSGVHKLFIDVLLSFVAFVIIIFMDLQKNVNKLNLIQVDSQFWNFYDIGVFYIITLVLINRWYIRSMYFAMTSIYILVANQRSFADKLESMKVCGFILLVAVIFRIVEVRKRNAFLQMNNYKLSMERLVKSLPDGFIVTNSKFNCLHYNSMFKSFFPNINTQQPVEIINFLKDITSPCLQTFLSRFKDLKLAKVVIEKEARNSIIENDRNQCHLDGSPGKLKDECGERGSFNIDPNITSNVRELEDFSDSRRKLKLLRQPFKKNSSPISRSNAKLVFGEALDISGGFVNLKNNLDKIELSNDNLTQDQALPNSLHAYLEALFEVSDNIETLTSEQENDDADQYYFICNINKKEFEVIVSSLTFQQEECFIIIFRDRTYHNIITSLQNEYKYQKKTMAIVSHELRSPIHATLSFLEQYVSFSDTHEKKNDLITKYIKPAENLQTIMLGLVNDILDKAQIDESKLKMEFQPIHIPALVRQAIQVAEYHANLTGSNIITYLDTKIPDLFFTDSNRLMRVLINLLTNACKFTKNGQIIVRVELLDKPIYTESAKMLLKFSVEDTGIGIAQENMKSLFIEFEKIRLEPCNQGLNPNGCGLGLTISNELVKLLSRNGKEGINVASVLGRGSTFSFIIEDKCEMHKKVGTYKFSSAQLSCDYKESGETRTAIPIEQKLQLVKSTTHKTKEILVASSKTCKQSLHIDLGASSDSQNNTSQDFTHNETTNLFIVDDDVYNHKIIKGFSEISRLPIRVISCYNGSSALNTISKAISTGTINNCDYILMDCMMPDMDGFTCALKIKESFKRYGLLAPEIIGVSSVNVTEIKDKLNSNGISRFIEKPLTLQKFLDVFRKN